MEPMKWELLGLPWHELLSSCLFAESILSLASLRAILLQQPTRLPATTTVVASWMEERTFSDYCEFWRTNIFYYESFIVRTNDLSDEEKRFIRFAASYFLLMDDRFAIQRSCVDQLSGSLQRQRLSLLPHHKHKTPYYWTTITLRGAKPYQLQLHNHVESIRWLRPRRRRWGKQGVERMQQRNL